MDPIGCCLRRLPSGDKFCKVWGEWEVESEEGKSLGPTGGPPSPPPSLAIPLLPPLPAGPLSSVARSGGKGWEEGDCQGGGGEGAAGGPKPLFLFAVDLLLTPNFAKFLKQQKKLEAKDRNLT